MRSEARVFCVAGMHRSGTSLVASMLNLLDVDLGPVEQLLPPQPDNPRGFWEQSAFTALNDEILAATGGTWDEPPALPRGWQDDPALEPLRKRARSLIRSHFGRARAWGWKDPRNSLTLAFWRSLLPQMRFVVCLRNPLDVSRSLADRNAFAPGKSDALWLRYTQEALANTAGAERLLLFYEDLMSDNSAELRRLLSFVRRRRVQPRAGEIRSLRRSIQPDLQHHRSSLHDVLDSNHLSFASQSLYAVLRTQGGGREQRHFNPDAVLDRFGEICGEARRQAEQGGELAQRLQAAEAYGRERQAAQASAETELRESRKTLEVHERTAREVLERLQESARALEAARTEMVSIARRRDELERSLAGRTEELASERRCAADLDHALQLEAAAQADLRVVVADKDAELRQLGAELAAERAELAKAGMVAGARDAEIGRLTLNLRAITESRAYPVLKAMWAVANFLAPADSRRLRVLKSLLKASRGSG